AVARLKPSGRGEYEITEAIQGLIDGGEPVRSHIVTGYWKDTGTVEAMLDANRLLLEDLIPSNAGDCQECRIEGRVRIEPGAVLRRATVRGPAIIGADCRLTDVFVGPFTAIDRGASLTNVEIEDSIVLAESVLENLPARVSGSLLGRGARVRGRAARPVALRLVLGDSSEVDLP
ncbi:glucose-1-phosphate thymidylyltransferase, partial [bacterium]